MDDFFAGLLFSFIGCAVIGVGVAACVYDMAKISGTHLALDAISPCDKDTLRRLKVVETTWVCVDGMWHKQ